LKKTVNFVITTTKTLYLAKILLYSIRNLDLYFLSQRVLRVLTDKIPPSAMNSESKTVYMANIALFSCSSIGVAVGQLAVLPTGDRVTSSSL